MASQLLVSWQKLPVVFANLGSMDGVRIYKYKIKAMCSKDRGGLEEGLRAHILKIGKGRIQELLFLFSGCLSGWCEWFSDHVLVVFDGTDGHSSWPNNAPS